jgi:hypothetical protein
MTRSPPLPPIFRYLFSSPMPPPSPTPGKGAFPLVSSVRTQHHIRVRRFGTLLIDTPRTDQEARWISHRMTAYN